jgi:hypothetical protein
LQIAEGLLRDDAGFVGLVRENDGLRHGDTEVACKSALEELLVRLPPEGVVDHHRPVQGGALQERPVVTHLMRDAVDDDAVAGWDVEFGDFAEDRQLRLDAVGLALVVDCLEEWRREGVLHADEKPDSVHQDPSIPLRSAPAPDPRRRRGGRLHRPTLERLGQGRPPSV